MGLLCLCVINMCLVGRCSDTIYGNSDVSGDVAVGVEAQSDAMTGVCTAALKGAHPNMGCMYDYGCCGWHIAY